MSAEDELLSDSAEELFEEAPCGYVTTELDGTIVRVNRTFERWTGHDRSDLLGRRKLQDLLTGGGRIYHETHYAPLLRMQGAVREIALDVVRADGSRLPTLMNSVMRADAEGRPRVIRTTIFDATDRRRYERELVLARERERDTALALQRSLLTGELPEHARLAIHVSYRSAVRNTEVGGDWYDAFALGGDRIAIVVGDVVGRGLEAAATMGQLRSAIRAFASVSASPAEVLEGLDAFSRRHGVGQMATVVYADIDVTAGELRYACAGHPPPALVDGTGTARFLMDGRSLPLGAFLRPRPRSGATVALEPGSAVVLYTDGLIERRDQSLDTGLDRLLAALAGVDLPVDVADAVMQSMMGREPRADDVCVLAAVVGRQRVP